MLKRKHRIIPIVLEGVSQMNFDMDKNLKGIINSVTYLEWPGFGDDIAKKTEKFWKRLQLSLPKKKVSEYSDSCTSDSMTGSSRSTVVSSIKSDSVKSSSYFKRKPIDFRNRSSSETAEQVLNCLTLNTLENNISDFYDGEEIYDEIVDIDETLTIPVSGLIEQSGENVINGETNEGFCYDYADIGRGGFTAGYDYAYDTERTEQNSVDRTKSRCERTYSYECARETDRCEIDSDDGAKNKCEQTYNYDYADSSRNGTTDNWAPSDEVRYIEFRSDGADGQVMDIIKPGYIEFQI